MMEIRYVVIFYYVITLSVVPIPTSSQFCNFYFNSAVEYATSSTLKLIILLTVIEVLIELAVE